MQCNYSDRGGGSYNQNRQERSSYSDSYAPGDAGLPQGYLVKGYFNQVTNANGEKRRALRREYIIDYPKKIAAALADEKKNKSAQLRKFYDCCVALRARMDSGQSFQEIEGELCQLLPYANSAESRDLVSHVFVDFIEKNVEQIKDAETFKAFVKHFEAVIAYMK